MAETIAPSMQIYTDFDGLIRGASDAGCSLLGVATEGAAVKRKLPLFFVQDRPQIFDMMGAASSGLPMHFASLFQGLRGPRRKVAVKVHRVGDAAHNLLEWELSPLGS